MDVAAPGKLHHAVLQHKRLDNDGWLGRLLLWKLQLRVSRVIM